MSNIKKQSFLSNIEIESAKKKIENLVFPEEGDGLVPLCTSLSLAERVIISCGEFNHDIRYGTMEFFYSGNAEVKSFPIEKIENDTIEGGVIIKIYESNMDATDRGFYSEKIQKTIETGGFK